MTKIASNICLRSGISEFRIETGKIAGMAKWPIRSKMDETESIRNKKRYLQVSRDRN